MKHEETVVSQVGFHRIIELIKFRRGKMLDQVRGHDKVKLFADIESSYVGAKESDRAGNPLAGRRETILCDRNRSFRIVDCRNVKSRRCKLKREFATTAAEIERPPPRGQTGHRE